MGTIEEEMPKSCDNMNASEDATVFIQIDPNALVLFWFRAILKHQSIDTISDMVQPNIVN